jgi:hypothetical protein
MKYSELTDVIHKAIIEFYTRWLNDWQDVLGFDTFIKTQEFGTPWGWIDVAFDQSLPNINRIIIMNVDNGADGGPAYLIAEVDDNNPKITNLVQGFDTYTSIIINSYQYQDPHNQKED